MKFEGHTINEDAIEGMKKFIEKYN